MSIAPQPRAAEASRRIFFPTERPAAAPASVGLLPTLPLDFLHPVGLSASGDVVPALCLCG